MNSMSSWLKNTGSGYFKEREARKMITEKEGRELMTTYFDEWGRAAKVAIQSHELEDWLYASGITQIRCIGCGALGKLKGILRGE